MEVNGQIDGELHCTSLVIARGAHVTGTSRARSRCRGFIGGHVGRQSDLSQRPDGFWSA